VAAVSVVGRRPRPVEPADLGGPRPRRPHADPVPTVDGIGDSGYLPTDQRPGPEVLGMATRTVVSPNVPGDLTQDAGWSTFLDNRCYRMSGASLGPSRGRSTPSDGLRRRVRNPRTCYAFPAEHPHVEVGGLPSSSRVRAQSKCVFVGGRRSSAAGPGPASRPHGGVGQRRGPDLEGPNAHSIHA
jgi:hypothetical protein